MEQICSVCGRSFEMTEESRFCPYCGTDQDAAETYADTYSAWEDRNNVGFLRALFDTWLESVFRPAKFFSTMPVKGGLGSPLLYGFIVGEIAVLFSLFWQAMYMMMGSLGESFGEFGAMDVSMATLIMAAILSPVLVIIGFFLSAGVVHICLMIVGGAQRDFEATFRVVCYASGGNLFGVLPFCGSMVAAIWNAVLIIIGIKESHEISTGKAFVAYMLPTVLCCGLITIISMFAMPELAEMFEGVSP